MKAQGVRKVKENQAIIGEAHMMKIRFVFAALGIVVMALMLMSGAYSAEKRECGETRAASSGDHAAVSGTEVSENPDVWWGNRGRAFGNYMKFAKTDIPEIPKGAETKFDTIYFELDKAELLSDGIRVAEQVLACMREHPNAKVRIEGHCCDLHSDEYNLNLGLRRAEAVKKYLTERGIDASRVETISFGERRRITTNPKQRPLNRRAEVYVKISE